MKTAKLFLRQLTVYAATTCAGACFFSACSGAFSTVETVTGFVQSGGTDENDNPIKIFIFDGKTEYHVTESIAEKQLRDLVDRKIKATGEVSDSGEGSKTISVKDYKVLD